MSTKATLKFNSNDEPDFHLYVECGESGCVYLQLGSIDRLKIYDGKVTVRIPQSIFSAIGKQELIEALDRHNESINIDNNYWTRQSVSDNEEE